MPNKLKNIKLVLFDLDDTLCNTRETFRIAETKSFNYLKNKYPLLSFPLFNKFYLIARQKTHSELKGSASSHNRLLYFQKLFELLGLPIKPSILNEITNIYWNYIYNHIKLYPQAKSTLKLLKQNNLKVGLVTDSLLDIQIEKLRRLSITDYIDFIVSSEEAGKEKPHSAMFLLALKKGNCKTNETIMIGDNLERDIRGANKMKITTILKNTFRLKNTRPADYIINDLNELTKILGITQKQYKNKKIIVFDLMGTIFSEGHIIKKILHPFLIKRGYKISYKKIKELYVKYTIGKISNKQFRKIVPKEIEEEFLNLIKIDKSMLEIIKKLRKEYLLGILSNIPTFWGKYLLKKYNLNKYFNPIIFSADYYSRKPNEKLYIEFINAAKIKPENCYFIDDKLINLQKARFLLMKTIWLKREKKEIIFIPDYKINKLFDLTRIL
ncbi:MAG: HAD-IA family hydrolase [Candidatus Aenigmarchaeota archaeon]|nr:HAD-IA family hydrolase [Candidatus Aenigmarchaeota archaeon]